MALALVTAYAAVIATTIGIIGVDGLETRRGFYRFLLIAGAASPLLLGALIAARVALGSALIAMIAAASLLLMLVRVARGEASAAGMKFAGGWLVLLLIVEILVGRWVARRSKTP